MVAHVFTCSHSRAGFLGPRRVCVTTTQTQIQALNLTHHRNVVSYYGSFLQDAQLWIVMAYCSFGSCLDIMNTGAIAIVLVSAGEIVWWKTNHASGQAPMPA